MYIRFLGFACVVLLLVAAAIAQESYDQVLHHWGYDKSAPLNIKQSGIEKRDGVTIYDISFSSPVGDRSAAVGPNGSKVTAYDPAAMERAQKGHDALPAGDIAGQLDRRLDRLGAGIGQKQLPIAFWLRSPKRDSLQPWRASCTTSRRENLHCST